MCGFCIKINSRIKAKEVCLHKSKISSKQSSQFLCRILVQKMYTIYRDTQWYILQVYRSNRNRYKRRAGTLLSGVIKISIGASIGVYKKQERKVKENIKESGKGYAAAALLLLFLLLLRLPLSGLFGREVLDQKEGLFFGARETLCRRNGECTVRGESRGASAVILSFVSEIEEYQKGQIRLIFLAFD